jgi:hypothetical protein
MPERHLSKMSHNFCYLALTTDADQPVAAYQTE